MKFSISDTVNKVSTYHSSDCVLGLVLRNAFFMWIDKVPKDDHKPKHLG